MSDRLDITRRGARDFDYEMCLYVASELEGHHVGEENRIAMAEFAERLGIDGRTIRAIIRELDGRAFVVAGGDNGLYIATAREQARKYTRRLQATARSYLERAERRRMWAAEHLQPVQFAFWGDE